MFVQPRVSLARLRHLSLNAGTGNAETEQLRLNG
jgi:hypothetical protein